MFVFDCSPEVLIHDGVVVTLDGHLLEVDVEIVAAKNGGGALRVHRGLDKVGARIFKVFRPSAQTGGKFAQPVNKDKNFPVCIVSSTHHHQHRHLPSCGVEHPESFLD